MVEVGPAMTPFDNVAEDAEDCAARPLVGESLVGGLTD